MFTRYPLALRTEYGVVRVESIGPRRVAVQFDDFRAPGMLRTVRGGVALRDGAVTDSALSDDSMSYSSLFVSPSEYGEKTDCAHPMLVQDVHFVETVAVFAAVEWGVSGMDSAKMVEAVERAVAQVVADGVARGAAREGALARRLKVAR